MSSLDDNKKVEDIFVAMGAVKADSGKSLLDVCDVHLSEKNKEKLADIKELENVKMEESAEFVNAYTNMFGIENVNADRQVITEEEKKESNILKPGAPLDDDYMAALIKDLKKRT